MWKLAYELRISDWSSDVCSSDLQNIYTWFQIGPFNASVGFMVDRLTAMMLVVVSFVSLLVHVYTIGYMRDDPGYTRFFSYISLFTFSMFMLEIGRASCRKRVCKYV